MPEARITLLSKGSISNLIVNMISLYISQLFIKLMNTLLSYNEGTCELLKKFAYKNFYLKFGVIDIFFAINEQGLFSSNTDNEDVRIFIPYDLFNYFIHQDKIKFLQKIKIEGSIDIAIQFLETISNINISHKIYSTSVYKIPWTIIKILVSLNHNIYKNIFSYLQYEKNCIVGEYELKAFCEEVDLIKNKCDFLEYSIKNIKL